MHHTILILYLQLLLRDEVTFHRFFVIRNTGNLLTVTFFL